MYRWRWLRLLCLAAQNTARSKLKFVLLATLVAVGALVFLSVNELARASEDNLSEAIDADLGTAGTYRVTPSSGLEADRSGLLESIQAGISTYTNEPLQAALTLPPLQPDCPPYEQIGEVHLVVILDQSGEFATFDRGAGVSSEADLCLAGMVIPQSAIRTASPREKVLFGTSFVLDPAYARAAGLTSAVPAGLVVIVKTGKVEDQTDAIRESLIASLTDFALRSGIPKEGVVVVSRADSGEAVRAASSGIKLVYSLIGWGVLLVSGLGLLVAELIVLRDRTWFFGLTRALGARRQDVAWLVLCDIALVLVVGFGLAVLLALATGGAVSQFGEAAFQVDLRILQPSMLPGLLAAFLSMLCLAGGYPAWRATRLDPLEVLERR
jgi:hypothetical protein